jgi:hypothetical protein
VGFDTYLNEYGPATIWLYGSAGLLGTYNHSHDPSTIGFWGVISDEPIYRIQWMTSGGAIINTGIDNLRLGENLLEPGAVVPGEVIPVAAVPLPGAALLGLGYSGLRLRRRTP